MEVRAHLIPIRYTNERINSRLAGLSGTGRYSRCFTQTEDFFLRFDADYEVPRFPIHHNVQLREPDPAYLAMLENLLDTVVRLAPEVFEGLTYFFDPEEVFKPCFYRLYKKAGRQYLYLLRLDLGFRAHHQIIIDRGDNDSSHGVRTSALFVEPLCLPLEGLEERNGKLSGVWVRSFFSETWIGEYGRGYFIQGIWMDTDLSKFFTRLFLPPDRHLYPYYPLLCKYRTIAAMPIFFSRKEREQAVSVLEEAIRLISPSLTEIQDALKKSSFSDTLPIFRELKQKMDPVFPVFWENIRVRTHLNEYGRKEYTIEHNAV
ncbi:MAG TPA: hypothetical protein ENN69_04130 [Spirochaetia bacterium]|nr:hypothetical protein [Spirochaetia bacterium]